MHGAVINLDNAGGTPVDITVFVKDGQVKVERNTGETHSAGNLWSDGVQGGLKAEMTLEVYVTNGASEAFELLSAWIVSSALTGRNRTITIDRPDSLTGSKRLTGEWLLKSLDPWLKRTGGSGDAETVKATLINSGAITPSII